MGEKTTTKVYRSQVGGSVVGGDMNITNIIMLQDSEREFVVTHNADIKPVSYFTGRETELKELRQRIEEGRKSVLVSGMGGIGKTHICRKLFEEYLNIHAKGDNESFCHIGYIEYAGDMGASLMSCLKYRQQGAPEQNQEAAWKELEYLAADGKLLLFVDNVNVSVREDAGLGRLKGIPGAVVLTSRRTSFSKEFEPYRIGFLSTEQCIEIYERIRYEDSGKKVSEEAIPDLEYIIENMAAGHTITVEFLAHLAQTKHWSVKRLREELENKGFQLEYKDEEDRLINIQEEYEKLYDLSELTEAEQNILEAFSVFPYIPLAAKICNRWLLADAGVNEGDDVLIGLYRKGWLQFDIEHESYAIHPVFARFIYDKCKPKSKNHLGLIKACQDCIEIPHNGLVLKGKKFISFAESIIEKMHLGDSVELVNLIVALAFLLQYIAEYKKAEKWYRVLLQIFKNREDYLGIANCYNSLAYICEIYGNYLEAERLYKKSLVICEGLGENYVALETCYNNLAGVYSIQGKYQKSEEYYIKSLKIIECIFGENHFDTARSYNNLATVYHRLGRFKEAEKLYEKSLRIRKQILGENHPVTAMCYNNLASLYWEQGKYNEAKVLYQKSLEIRESMQENHPDTAMSYNNLAGVYFKQGQYERAEELYKKSIEIREQILGEKHIDTAMCYNNLASVYGDKGEYKKAVLYFFKAYSIFYLKLGAEHPSTQFIYENLIFAYSVFRPESNFEQWLEEQMKE